MRNPMAYLILSAIVLFGAWFRVTGIGWGLPDGRYFHASSFHPDEGDTFNAMRGFRPSRLDFRIRNYILTRGSFQVYLTAAWVKAGSLLGLAKISPSFDYYKAHPKELARLYVSARSLSVFFGLATIVLVFFMGRAFYGDPVHGLLAAFLLAIAPGHVVWSHYIGTDAIMAFQVCALILISYFMATTDNGRWYLYAGLLAGVTVATKYSAAPLCAIPLLAAVLGRKPFFPRRVLVYLACIPAGFFLANPYSLIDMPSFIAAIRTSLRTNILADGSIFWMDCFEKGSGWWYHLTVSPYYNLGLPLALLALVSLVYALFRRELPALIMAAAMLVLWFLLGSSPWRVIRWFTPFIPLLCILIARFMLQIKGKAARPASFSLLALTVLYTAGYSYAYVRMMASPDVRDIASEWIERSIPEGETIAVPMAYFWNPTITMTEFWYKPSEPFFAGLKRYRILRTGNDAGLLKKEKPACVVLADNEYYPLLKLKRKYPVDFALPVLREITESGTYSMVKEFDTQPRLFGRRVIRGFYPHDWRYPCPVIRVYRRNGTEE